MTKHTFSAGKSLAQKFGVKYIETSPGNSDNTLFTIRLQKREKNEGFGYLAVPAWHNRQWFVRKVGFSNAPVRVRGGEWNEIFLSLNINKLSGKMRNISCFTTFND